MGSKSCSMRSGNAATVLSAQPSATRQLSTTTSPPSTTCRADGPTSRMAGIIVSSVEMTKRCSVTPSDRIHGRSFCTNGQGVRVVAEPDPDERFAFIGVRSCELHAIAIQDKVFLGGDHVDPHYRARRQDAFIIAVNCGQAGG